MYLTKPVHEVYAWASAQYSALFIQNRQVISLRGCINTGQLCLRIRTERLMSHNLVISSIVGTRNVMLCYSSRYAKRTRRHVISLAGKE